MWRTRIAAIALAVSLFASVAAAQVTLYSEDFSTAVGQVPPTGWSTKAFAYLAQVKTDWRFDNPGGRATPPGMTAPFAICDPDNAGFGVGGTSFLRSATFDTSIALAAELMVDRQLRDLSSGWSIDVFDGLVWNTVAAQANNTVNADINYPAVGVGTETFNITAAAGGAMNAQLRFSYQYGYDWWYAIDNILVQEPAAVDLALVSIDTPVDQPLGCIPVQGNNTVTVTFQNNGAAPVVAGTMVQFDFSVNAGPINTEFLNLPTTMNFGDSAQFTFAGQANLPAPGPNTLDVAIVLLGDGNAANDTQSGVYGGNPTLPTVALPYFENFDSTAVNNSLTPPTGWQQDTADAVGTDSDWHFYSGITTSFNTGPANGDHTTGAGYYAYVEDSGGEYAQVNLLSPCMDLSLSIAPIVQFWMHSWNYYQPSNENFLSVDIISFPGGAVTMDAFGPVGHQQTTAGTDWSLSQWTQQTVNLAAYVGQTVQIRFRGRSDGGSTNHDIAIDDVSVFDPMPTPGQNPRPGLAVFDINNSQNINNATVSSGLNGPYYAGVTQGSNMTMSFDGAPNQPIAVLYGPLNPVSATFPGGVGQFDIGGPGVNGAGIPVGIGVFVDAISWSQGGFIGLPIDSMFFTSAAGALQVAFTFPNFGIPMGTPLTAFQSAITTPAAPFVYLSNAVQVNIN
ncbi:MAG: choice-of-anchor J domain-containing protein [Planctomycetes bacterium]|nr:choice-of-anchor J domain-containing protein [Planctomycetota bacterium]